MDYELQRDILGRKDSTCQGPGTKSAGCVSEPWLALGRSEDGGVWMRQTRPRSCWVSHRKNDSQDKVFSERSLFSFHLGPRSLTRATEKALDFHWKK